MGVRPAWRGTGLCRNRLHHRSRWPDCRPLPLLRLPRHLSCQLLNNPEAWCCEGILVGPLTEYPDFLRMPPDIATCMYYTGIDPFTKEQLYIAPQMRHRELQRALLQFFKPENYFMVREAI